MAALTPHLIVVNSYLLTEALFTFLFLVSVYGFHDGWMARSSLWHRAALGGLLGASALVRPVL